MIKEKIIKIVAIIIYFITAIGLFISFLYTAMNIDTTSINFICSLPLLLISVFLIVYAIKSIISIIKNNFKVTNVDKIILLIFLVLLIVSFTKMLIVNYSPMVMQAYHKYSKDVDSGIYYYMQSEEYAILEENDKMKEVHSLLKLYQKNNIITNLHYDKENKLYSFQYNDGEQKGILGGVSFQNWSSDRTIPLDKK